MDRFSMRRRSDGLVYAFARETGVGKAAMFVRSDQGVRVVHDARFGWAIIDADGALLGRVWDTPPDAQGDDPPEGVWVSRKGDKSYVYDLIHEAP